MKDWGKFGNINITQLINYLRDDKILQNRVYRTHIFYTSNQIILELFNPKNYYKKFIERTKNQFPFIKDMCFIKNDGSCANEIKIII